MENTTMKCLAKRDSRAMHGSRPAGGLGAAVSPPAGSGAVPQKILKIKRFFSHEMAIFDFFQ